MADYYPLIAKAVAGLDKSTGDTRRALYDRARTALLAQLRGVEPALSEPDITRERLALEEAIRKVENEVAFQRPPDARRLRGEPVPLRPEQGRGEADLQEYADSPGYGESEETRQAIPLSAAATARAADAEVRRAERWSPGGPSLSDNGLRSFREGLGGAGESGAVRTYPSDRDFRRIEQGAGQWAEDEAPVPVQPRLPSRDSRSLAPVPADPNDGRGRALQSFPRVVRQEQRALTTERERAAPAHSSSWNAPRNTNRIVAIAVIALMAAGIGGFAMWFSDDIMALLHGAPGKTPDANASADSGTRSNKIDVRAPSAFGTESASAPQKVVLYEEDPSNPAGAQFPGSAIWSTERVAPGPGQKPEVVIRGEIQIPDQKVAVRLSLRRNDDKQLPASHTVEINFKLPPDFPHGGIANIPGIMVKQGETNRGIALQGVAVKVMDNFFLVGLSAADAEMQRNVQLLKERSWFDIPIVYGDGKRALIAIEKGPPGERAFAEAFAAWDQQPQP